MRKRIARTLAATSRLLARLALRARGWPSIAGAEEPPPTPEPDKKFTQADIDRIVADRLTRDRKDRPTDDELAELRAKAAKADELEAANLSQAEKLQQEAAKAAEERDAARAAEQAALDRANKTLIRASIVTAAAKAGAVDPDDVHALMMARDFAVTKDGKTLQVTVGDDGQVTGHEEAVTAFLEGKQHLVGQTPTPGPGGGGPRPGPPSTALTEEEKAAARSFGMTDDEYGQYKAAPSAPPAPEPATT